MATIKSSLVLNDRMTNVLNRINVAMTTVIDSCEAVSVATGQAVDVHQWDVARVAIGEASAAIQEMEANYGEAASGQDRLNQKISTGTAVAGGLLGKITGLVSAYGILRGVEKVLDSSDGMMQTTARLNLMNDGLQSTGDLLNMVYSSAQNARGSLSGMAAVVTRIGNNVGIGEGKIFGSSAEVIAFSELVQKQMTIAGASATEAENAILQLSQGLASGALRGDELRSVAEQAPGIIQNIADYLGVTTGEIREMASEGLITADVVKNAMFDAADNINTKFETMPMTWDQVCQSMTNSAQMLFIKPVSEKIKDIIATDEFQGIVSDIQGNFSTLANIAVGAIDIVADVGSFAHQNWGTIAPIIGTITGALAAYTTALLVHKGVLAGTAIVQGIQTVIEYSQAKAMLRNAEAAGINTVGLTTKTAATVNLTTATGAAVGAEAAMQIATAKNTVAQAGFNTTLLACPLTWIVGAIIIVIALFTRWSQKTNEAKGVTVSFFGTLVGNLNIARVWFQNFVTNTKLAFNDMVGGLRSNWHDFVADFWSGIVSICESLNTLPFVEFDYSGISSKEAYHRQRATELATGGYTPVQLEEGWQEKAFLEGVGKYNEFVSKYTYDPNSTDPYVSSIAGDTGSIANSLDKTNEELEWIRDIAEREVINRFTTAEVKVDFTGMTNQISNDMDLDGVISGFVGKFKESLQTAAQGVY